MTDIFNEPTKPLTGGLSQFKVLTNSDELSTGATGNNVWAETWAYRGGFPFRINTGKSTSIVFLTDVIPLIVLEVAIGEKQGPTGRFPLKEYVRSMSITGVEDDGSFRRNSEECLFEKALGRKPKFIYVAKILDMTEFIDRDKVQHKWSIRHIIIDNSSVINQLAAVCEVHGRDMQYGRFKVSRSVQTKSPRIGDSWVLVDYLDPEKSLVTLDGYEEKVNKIDIDKGFPVYDAETAKQILEQHKKVADGFPEAKGFLTYNRSVMTKTIGAGSVAQEATPGPSIQELEPGAYDPATEETEDGSGSSDLFDDLPLPV